MVHSWIHFLKAFLPHNTFVFDAEVLLIVCAVVSLTFQVLMTGFWSGFACPLLGMRLAH